MAVLMELPLTLRECDGVVFLERDAAVGAAKVLVLEAAELGAWFSALVLDEMLPLRLGVVGSGTLGDVALLRGWRVDATLPKCKVFDVSVGLVTGVVEAMVPPTPVLDVGLITFVAMFLVMEQLAGCTLAVGAIRAGLCGEPIAMTKGTLVLDELLSFRCGKDGLGVLRMFMGLETAELS